jgi:uncharacterized delta-60 repeat protein
LFSLRVGNIGAAANAIFQQADGKLVLVGAGNPDGDFDDDLLVVRLNADGTRDNTFGNDGIASADFGGSEDVAQAVIQQPDGKLVVAGSGRPGGVQGANFALARFDVNGTLDASFGNGGMVHLDLGGNEERATGLALQASGQLVIAGWGNAGGSFRTCFARFNADGSLDGTFGTGGFTAVDFGGGSENWPNDLAAQPDGALVAAGTVSGPDPLRLDMGLVRVTADGLLDDSFDGDGLRIVDAEGVGDEARAVAIQPDGAIVVAGYSVVAGDNPANAALIRLDSSGALDPGFGNAGVAVVDLGNHDLLYAVAVQTDGRIAVAGLRTTQEQYPDAILARFQANGTLDAGFGDGGVTLADFGDPDLAPWSFATDLLQQADGKLVAAVNNGPGVLAAVRVDDAAAYPGRIGLIQNFHQVSEAGTASVDYIVRRSGGNAGSVSVDFATAPGSAEAGEDYIHAAGTLSWNDGEYGDRTITVDLIDDELAEQPEDFSMRLSAPTGGAHLASAQSTTTISSEDGAGFLGLLFAPDPIFVPEADAVYQVFVTRLHGSEGPISIQYRMHAGSATAGVDFVATTGTLSWADGETQSRAIELQVFDDGILEENEVLEIELFGATGGAAIAASGARQFVVIADNERGFRISQALLTVSEGGGSIALDVGRIGDWTGAVSVNYATASGTATAGADFTAVSGTLNWADGDGSARTIVINIIEDLIDESNETFSLNLSNPSAGMLLGVNATATITITDNDVNAVVPKRGGGGGALDWLGALLLCLLGLARRSATRPLGPPAR